MAAPEVLDTISTTRVTTWYAYSPSCQPVCLQHFFTPLHLAGKATSSLNTTTFAVARLPQPTHTARARAHSLMPSPPARPRLHTRPSARVRSHAPAEKVRRREPSACSHHSPRLRRGRCPGLRLRLAPGRCHAVTAPPGANGGWKSICSNQRIFLGDDG